MAKDAPRGASTLKLGPHDVIIIGVDTDDGPDHPLYDDRAFRELDPGRLANFQRLGIRSPIFIKSDNRYDKPIVIDGRGRVRYAREIERLQKEAGVDPDEFIKLRALKEIGSNEDLFGLSRALNLHDRDDPLTTARNVERMISYGKSDAEAAIVFGVSEQSIRNYRAMLQLSPEAQEAVKTAKLTPTAALQLASLPRAEQNEVLAEVQAEAASGKKPTVQRVRSKVAEKSGKEPNPNSPKMRIEKATNLLMKLSEIGNPTKDTLVEYMDKVCKAVTGHKLSELGDIGD